MADFTDTDLHGSTFDKVDLSHAEFLQVDLSNARFRAAYLCNVVMRGVELIGVDIYGELQNVVVNGVDIGPLVEAELDRRHPERSKMRPVDAAGFREAWDVVERLWDGTVTRARGLEPALLHESVGWRVDVHRDACDISCSPPIPGSGGRYSAILRPGMRSTSRGTRCPTRQVSPATVTCNRRSTTSSLCVGAAWTASARCSMA